MKQLKKLTLLCLLLCAQVSNAQQIAWQTRPDLNVLLPASVRVYEGNGMLQDGAPVRAMYATVDLRDQNLQLRAVGFAGAERQTTLEAYQEHDAILAINGGYFSPTASVSVFVSDGEVLAPHQSKPDAVTRAAFGMVNGKPDITWAAVLARGIAYAYTQPSKPATAKGARWLPSQAVGGGPMLVQSGKAMDTGEIEGFSKSHLGRNPRTAIGYLNEHTLLLMVVDGRQGASAGVTIPELAGIMEKLGCEEAVNLDGGGSSAMVAADEVVNIPTDIPNGNRNSLRRNANALVLVERKKSPQKEVLYFDTDSPHYTEYGLWVNTNHPNYYGSTLSRQASTNSGHFSAAYHFKGIQPGRYQLASWWTVDTAKNAARVPYVLHRAGKTDTLYADQNTFTGSGRWHVFGDFVLQPGDYLELLAQGKGAKVVADAVRLVALETYPNLPKRGDLRLAILSDLNSGLGAATYEWQVDSIIQRLPRLWQPDMVVCGGDMVAGQGVSDTMTLQRMWQGFEQHIAQPLRRHQIPFAFTLGNHDGSRSFPVERRAAAAHWQHNLPDLQFISKEHFPYYYSFMQGEAFFVSWEASSPELSPENLQWLEAQFASPQAQQAKYRFVLGHMPLYSVAQERDSEGNLLQNPDALRQLLQKHRVHTYISGHQHAFYPGKRGRLELLNAGAAGSGPRSWLTLEKEPMNTITLMDIFYEQDTIIYTTYDIKAERSADMAVLSPSALPPVIEGIHGHLLRRDIAVQRTATGVFYTLDGEKAGDVQTEIRGGQLYLQGQLTGVKNKLVHAALYQGRHTTAGNKVAQLQHKTRSRKFSGKLSTDDDLAELLSVGALYLEAELENGQRLRAQLYPAANTGPAAVAVDSHQSRNVYAVRDTEALFRISWPAAPDPDGDFVSYTYQLASDEGFTNTLWNRTTGRLTGIKPQEQDLFRLLSSAPGVAQTFYQRVISSDGKHQTYGPVTALQLMKSLDPLEDFVEVPAPNYVFEGKIEANGGGYGAQWDGQGKLWLADYNGTLYIQNPDGTPASFSPLRTVTVAGQQYDLRTIGGMGIDTDGNILIGRNRHLLKVNATTGEGMAAWAVPEGNRAITSPRAAANGEVYAMSLFGEDPNYVLRQQGHTFSLVRTLDLPERVLARKFAMAPDGKTLYFPNSGSPFIQVYTSADGTHYSKQEDITSIAAGCNALETGANGTLWAAVRPSGVMPATFHFRDEQRKRMWTLPLPELEGHEARGLGVSANGDTLIFCSWDKGGGFYRYVLQPEEINETVQSTNQDQPASAAAVRRRRK